jgi:hypothetical protein
MLMWAAVIATSSLSCAQPGKELDKMAFASPSNAYRPAPFWSWNDKLADDELRWQVRQLKTAGYGGFFMHPRVGLETEYLSDEWFRKIDACVDEARDCGMRAWLYDEDKWPSGFAGGWVNRKHPETHGVTLVVEEVKPAAVGRALANADTVAVFAFLKNGGDNVPRARRLEPGEPVQDGEAALRFRVAPYANDNWYNGETYIDVLNPDAVGQFLFLTLDGYNSRFRGDYGRTIPGIFTDEPNFRSNLPGRTLPWTPRMPELFRNRYGYDLIDRLPALVSRPAGFEKVRHDFWRLATEQFAEAFSRQYGQTCAKLGLKMTGHWLWEDTLRSQVEHIGAAMPQYEYEQVPGIDHLCRNIDNPLTLKQCASVAHQFGRDAVLCEIFGVSGQDFRFEDAKWIGDFHTALGVNYFCPHLTLYSFTGDRKRDYPPTFSYHQPYWSRMSVINDYFGRTGYLTRLGEFQSRILVLHPIASAWAYFSSAEACPEVDRYHTGLIAVQNALLAQHRDFDYGDEIILARHGRVVGRELQVASNGRYSVVVVPPSFTWAEKTVSLLETFARAGGKIVVVGEQPRAIDGRPEPKRWERVFKQANIATCENEPGALLAAIDAVLPRDVSVADDTGHEIEPILYHHRKAGQQDIYFFCNTVRHAGYDARITLRSAGTPVECDPATGKMKPMPAQTADGNIVLYHHFAPVGSLAVLVDPRAATAPAETQWRESERQGLHGDWLFTRRQPNTLVLDVCNYALDNAPLGPPTPVWKVRRATFDAAGLGKYLGIQPWVLTQRGIQPAKSVNTQMRFEFESDLGRPNAFLVVEKASQFAIRLNGQAVPTDTKEWHWDKQFTKMNVGRLIRKGMNELILTTQYAPGTEIEDVFIVGDFATRKISETRYALTSEPAVLATGDWVPQGYHFYAGNMTYRKRFQLARPGSTPPSARDDEPASLAPPDAQESTQISKTRPAQRTPETRGRRTMLRLIEPLGTLFDVSVNGRPAATIAWRPYEADISDLVHVGMNDLEITVYGSLRNSFGPLHNTLYDTNGNNWGIGPDAFTDEGHWTNRYQLAPYGLIYGAEVVTFEK